LILFLTDPNILWLDFIDELVEKVPYDVTSIASQTANSLLSLPTTTTSTSAGPPSDTKTLSEIIFQEEFKLKESYHHDGTHLHPRYLSLVEKGFSVYPVGEVSASSLPMTAASPSINSNQGSASVSSSSQSNKPEKK
jgi:hypothetical protein